MTRFKFVFWLLYWKYFYYLFKWFRHAWSGHSAIARLADSPMKGRASSIIELEENLRKSKNSKLKSLVDVFAETSRFQTLTAAQLPALVSLQESIDLVSNTKNVKSERGLLNLRLGLGKIHQYRALIRSVEEPRLTTFSEDDRDHIQLMKDLWKNLAEDIPFLRITKDWQSLGFQGKDPATDFRGMGLLGLSNLTFMATKHQDLARRMLSQSNHPKNGYSFAITGIDLTSMVYQLLVFGHLKSYFYKSEEDLSVISFQEAFVQVFADFNDFYFECNPESMMDYGPIRERFASKLKSRLKKGSLKEH